MFRQSIFSALLFSLLGAGVLSPLAANTPTVIGLFASRTETPISHEIILRFPIVLSKALQKSNRGYVVYPNEFSRRREKLELPNQVLYTPQQYKKLDDALEGGALITGEIYEYEKKTNTEKTLNNNDDTPIDIKSVLVKLHHYNARTKKRTTISVYAKDENIVFEMLRAIFPLENDRYLLNPIQAGASIALVTPLDDAEANDFYMRLLNDKFQVRLLSGNDFIKGNPTILDSLRNISSRFISYETAREVKENPPFVISAATDIQAEAQEHEEYLTTENEYLKNFSSALQKVLQKIRLRTQAQYLLVLNPSGSQSFARGFDLSTGSLFWFQDSFPSRSSSNEDILEAMIKEVQRPTTTLSNEQFMAIASEKDRMSSQGASGGLARVAILDFYDRTNSPLYTWLSGSLSSAVDDSMKKIFEYERNDETKSNAAGTKYFKSPADISSSRLKDFQKETNADYIIFGFYSLDKKTGNVVIESKVYDLMKNKAIGGSKSESPVDVRLFNSVDQIAQGIVQDIFTMTQRQNN